MRNYTRWLYGFLGGMIFEYLIRIHFNPFALITLILIVVLWLYDTILSGGEK